MKTFRDKLKELPKDRQKQIEADGQHLLDEYMTLQDIRKAVGLTQKEVADAMQIEQTHISRLERRTDMKVSTLKEFTEALGGKLHMSIEMPGKAPVSILGLINTNNETGI